jgi:glycosyltransferase involved in cell wall biosynthesis
VKILLLNPEGTLGGAERCLLDMLASFRVARPDIEMSVIAGGDGPLLEESRRLDAHVKMLPLPSALASLGDSGVRSRSGSTGALAKNLGVGAAALAQYVARLRKEIALFSPDIVQSNGMKMHLLGALARPSNARLVWYVHDFVGERRIASRALRALSRRAHLAITNSAAVRDDFARTVRSLPARVVLNAIDTDDFKPDGPRAPLDALADLAPSGDVLRVGLVATFARWKGQDIFLEAARVVRARLGERVRFYIVGSAIYRTPESQFSEGELRAKADALGVSDSVGFVPFQNDPSSVFRALDVVVHASSRPEPFGRTIVEAMACGRAVIGVAEGGAREIILPEQNALAFSRGDSGALAEAIIRLSNDEALRKRLGAEGRRDAVARFSRDRLAADMLRAYLAMGD